MFENTMKMLDDAKEVLDGHLEDSKTYYKRLKQQREDGTILPGAKMILEIREKYGPKESHTECYQSGEKCTEVDCVK